MEMLKIENDVWKEKLIKESWKKLEEVERKFKSKMERMETSYSNQLNEAEEEVRKREELFLTSMKRKPAVYHDTAAESNSEIGKSNVEVIIFTHNEAISGSVEWLISVYVRTLADSQPDESEANDARWKMELRVQRIQTRIPGLNEPSSFWRRDEEESSTQSPILLPHRACGEMNSVHCL